MAATWSACGDDDTGGRGARQAADERVKPAEKQHEGSGSQPAVSSFETAPLARDKGAQRIRADRDQPRVRSLRFVRNVGASRWYIGRATDGDVCLYATTSSISSMCAEIRRFKWATAELPAGGENQLTAVLIPDTYDRAKVTSGSAGEVIGPKHNLVFVRHDEPLTVRVTADERPPIRVKLRYIGPFGSQ